MENDKKIYILIFCLIFINIGIIYIVGSKKGIIPDIEMKMSIPENTIIYGTERGFLTEKRSDNFTEEYTEETEYTEECTDEYESGVRAKVKINTAGTEELMKLPGVNENIAEKIIELRQAIGGFTDAYELLLVDGINITKLSEMIEYVEIN